VRDLLLKKDSATHGTRERQLSMLHSFSENALQDDFWQLALGSLGSLQIGPICARSLRAWIATAVGRMRLENRLSTTDLAIARGNLTSLMEIIKTEAFILGRADRLDKDSFQAAHRQIERHAMLTAFNLWPFWPKEFAGTERELREI